jgi:hypothetical protein
MPLIFRQRHYAAAAIIDYCFSTAFAAATLISHFQLPPQRRRHYFQRRFAFEFSLSPLFSFSPLSFRHYSPPPFSFDAAIADIFADADAAAAG